MSSCTKVSCWVLQESCLGLLLFLLYIHDISLISNFDTTLFADDTCLMMADYNNPKFLNFSKTNYMVINKLPLKICQCHFRIALNGIIIDRAHAVKYLGLFIDCNLKWM